MQSAWPEPDAAAQLVFLQHLQRLFQEGDFSATYKYALLLALAELAIECDCADGAPLEIPMLRIADKFAEFYWLQATPYVGDRDAAGILIQNKGKQAAVVRHLITLRTAGLATMAQARQHSNWDGTIRDIANVVRKMPVRFLQNIPGGTVHFLFDPDAARRSLTLLPGVAFNLRRFQGFIQQLVRAGWVDHIRRNRYNAHLVGTGANLESFMFGTPRALLAKVQKILAPMQDHRCFFCAQALDTKTAVDHFIPWSRYPRDTALNFVVAHATCNADKRDLLAGERHLEHWLDRNTRDGTVISGELQLAGFSSEPGIASTVASWAYGEAVEAGVSVWQARGRIEPISRDLLRVFA
jgi:5-methylcytosine-specific restriction endonuclease McrA